MKITIYTDGAYSPQYHIGAWAAMLFIGDSTITLNGIEHQSTHNAMELLAILKGIEYIIARGLSTDEITVVTDSQYAVNLPERKEKLAANNFLTKKGNELRNAALVRRLLDYTAILNIHFVKVKAHQPKTNEPNYNREVDKLVRKILRAAVVS